MKKTVLLIVVLVIAAAAGGIYYVLTNLDSLVKQAIEKYGSEATQTAVRVQGVKISLKRASASVSGLTVANPAGFSIPNAFSLGKIAVSLNAKAISQKRLVIDNIVIHAPEVFYEINADKQGNLNKLKDNLGGSGQPASGKAADKSESEAAGPTITIHEFEFADAVLHAKVVPLNNKEYKLKLPSFQLTNLHGTPAQISKQVINQLIDRTRTVIKQQGIDAQLDKLKAQANEKIDTEKAKLKEKADTRVEEEKAKAQDKLKQLLGQ